MNKTKINYYIVINSRTHGKLQLTIGCASLISLSLYIHTFYITCHQPLVLHQHVTVTVQAIVLCRIA